MESRSAVGLVAGVDLDGSRNNKKNNMFGFWGVGVWGRLLNWDELMLCCSLLLECEFECDEVRTLRT